MNQLYHATTAKLHDAQGSLGRLEHSHDERDAQAYSQNIQKLLSEIDESCLRLDILVNKEPPNSRHMARMKVDQLKADSHAVNMAINTVYTRLTMKWRAASDREDLLKQRFRPNESTVLSFEGHELQMNDRLQSSNRQVDDLISQGAAVLESLRSQHMNLRGVRRKMMDVGAALGLSNTTILMIDRRVREDWWIFLIGCFVTLLFMYIFYRYWKG